MPQINVTGRSHPVSSIARWFDYSHLPENLQGFSQQFYDLAANMIHDLPDDPELTAGLRKLLEAKDCFVRASLTVGENTGPGDETIVVDATGQAEVSG